MRLAIFGLLLAFGVLACSRDAPQILPDQPQDPARVDQPVPQILPGGPGILAVALTREASELRRVREEHERLIASIPTPAPDTPTPSKQERQDKAMARVFDHPDGVPSSPSYDRDWFDPDKGLTFYRDSGGDWTARKVREGHTHRGVFYYDNYPDGVLNFPDESIYPALARELAFAAADVMPLLGDPTPAMVKTFSDNLGWEIRDSPEPLLNIWTKFTFEMEREDHTFAVGGVMLMGVSSIGEGASRLQYVEPGHWVGSVVVERLE